MSVSLVKRAKSDSPEKTEKPVEPWMHGDAQKLWKFHVKAGK